MQKARTQIGHRVSPFILIPLVVMIYLLRGGPLPLAQADMGEQARSARQAGLSPEVVQLFREQAKARKALLESQAQAKRALRAAQKTARDTLLVKNRDAMKEFRSRKTTAAERTEFYRGLRRQMRDLRAAQSSEMRNLEAAFKSELIENRQMQRTEERKLRESLAKDQSAAPQSATVH